MAMASFTIISPGILSSIQDKGRYEHQHSGMGVAGVMDKYSASVANILCGNNDDAAVLEMTLIGSKIRFDSDAYIGITGAQAKPMVDNFPVKMWSAFPVKAGRILSFSGSKYGQRIYLAVSGGIDVPMVMGSRSTNLMAGIGGLHGKALEAGDVVPIKSDLALQTNYKELAKKYRQKYNKHDVLRVVLGPQDNAFTTAGIESFLSSVYTVSPKCNRMGYRLDGSKIEHVEKADIISDGIVMGAIQVTGEGTPIILMADRQTAGGYTKIAGVIEPDLSKVAQAGPGSSFEFCAISIEQAQVEYNKREKLYNEIRQLYN